MEIRISDVARHAGVSPATVSRVLNDYPHVRPAVRERVLSAIEELGYRRDEVARSMRRRSTGLIGFLARNSRNPNFAAIYSAALERAETHGCSVLVCNSQGDPAAEARYLELLVRQRVDGIVAYVADESVDNFEFVDLASVPYVLVESVLEARGASRVISDADAGVRSATEHLISLGHREIGVVLGRRSIWPSHQRLAGFRSAMSAAGLESAPELIRWCDESEAGSAREVSALLDLPRRPTALVTTTNLITTACVLVLGERGLRLPTDISVVGFDDSEVARLAGGGLTVVRRQLELLGSEPVDLLMDHVRAGPSSVASRTVVIPCELLVRNSTSSPAEAAD